MQYKKFSNFLTLAVYLSRFTRDAISKTGTLRILSEDETKTIGVP